MEKLLPDGIKLLLIGQMTVLSFLGCIVLTIKSITWIVGIIKGKPADALSAPAQSESEDEEAMAAAIAAAIHKNRTRG